MRMRAICAAVLALVLLTGCGATETIHSHEYKEETMTLSCTQDAGTRYTCECGHSYMDVEIKAAGHQYESVLVNQKGDIPAYTQYTCSVCGDDECAGKGHWRGQYPVRQSSRLAG